MKLSNQQKQTIRDMYAAHTNAEIGQAMGIPTQAVKFQARQLGLTKPAGFLSSFQKRNTGGMATRLTGGTVRTPPGTVAWLSAGGSSTAEWHIYRGRGHPISLKRYLWETHIGPVPPGYVVRYADGNPRRCVLSNLECISRTGNVLRNTNREKQRQTYAMGGYADSYYASRLFMRDWVTRQFVLTNAPELIAAYKQTLTLRNHVNQLKQPGADAASR